MKLEQMILVTIRALTNTGSFSHVEKADPGVFPDTIVAFDRDGDTHYVSIASPPE